MALTKPFAENGNKTPIPPTTTDGSVSYDQGFGSFYALPPEEGGLFIDRAQFNQLMYDTTSQVLANKTAIATKANTSEVVKLTTNQNIQGVKTFASPPVSATNPTNNNQVANKSYVDTVGNTAVKLTGNQEIAGVKTFTNDITAPNIAQIQNSINTINNKFSSLESGGGAIVTTKSATTTLTVGTGGTFSTFEEAWQEAKKYLGTVTIKLVSNIQNNKDINFVRTNGKNISFDFNGFKLENIGSRVFNFTFNGCSINSITDLSLEGYMLVATNNSSLVLNNSVTINDSQARNSNCIRSWFGSTVAVLENTTLTLFHAPSGGSFYATGGSIIGIGANSTINDNSSDGVVFNIYRGGIIQVAGVTINNTGGAAIANQAANTPTADGIIFGSYSL
jgi:hypothetical protein